MIVPRIPVKRSDSPDADSPLRYCIPNPYGMQHNSFDRVAPDAAVGYTKVQRRESPLKIKNSALDRYYRPEFLAQSSSLNVSDIDGCQPRDMKYKDRGRKKSGFSLIEPLNGTIQDRTRNKSNLHSH